MANNKAPSEADVIFNRANVALARSQRLIQSWLPPKTAEEVASTKTDQEVQIEDDELFKPAPELLGVGAAVPDDDQDRLIRRKGPASNQRLLEQLLGKKAAKGHIASHRAPSRAVAPILATSKSDHGAGGPAEDSGDDEQGRASAVTSINARRKTGGASANKSKPGQTLRVPIDQSEDASTPALSSDEDDKAPSRKRPLSYLDQLLAEKASKKKQKTKKAAGGGDG